MKKILTGLLLLFSWTVGAQNWIEVSYQPADSIPEITRELMDFQGVHYLKINVHGDIKGKKWTLWVNEADGGKVKSEALESLFFEFSDTLAVFTFMAQDRNDTVNIAFRTPNYRVSSKKYVISTDGGTAFPMPYILMETFPPQAYTTVDEIALVAYTTGIKRPDNMFYCDYCGLRDAKIPPAQWQEKHGIPRFVYFSLRLE